MNRPKDNEQPLAPLRDLPVEVSVEQVALMVAAFPLAVGTVGWLTTLKTNLNTILMISIGTFIIGTAIYFMPVGTPEAQNTLEPQVPEINAPTPISTAPQVENDRTGELSVLPVVDIDRALVAVEPVIIEPISTPPIAPLAATVLLPLLPPTLPTSVPVPTAPLAQNSANEKTYDLRDFNAVASFVSADISVEEGPWSVSASGDPDQIERLDIKVENGVLQITMKKKDKRTRSNDRLTLKVEVHMPQLTRLDMGGSGNISVGEFGTVVNLVVSVMGSGDIELKGLTVLGELTLLVQGSGDIKCRSAIVLGRTSATVLGSGDVKASGTTPSIEVLVQGSGDVDFSAMQAQGGKVTVLGSGDVRVNSVGNLEQLIQGSGTIQKTGSTGGTGE